MDEYQEDHYKCVCGTRAVQLTLLQHGEGDTYEPAKSDKEESR